MAKIMASGWRRLWRGLLLLASLALATAALAQETGVAARVNGVDISNFRLERYFEDFLKLRGRNLGTIRHPQAYKRLKREALDRLVDRELLVQEAERRGIQIPAEQVVAAREQVASGFKTRATFLVRLSDAGFNEASFDDYLRRDLLAQRALTVLADETPPAATAEADRRPPAERRREAEALALQNLRQAAQIKILLPL